MSLGFEVGRVYNRRADIHGRFGGQQQGGIITPARHPLVMIITGEEGLAHGYADRQRSDGVFEYFGEGQKGDMRLRAGNRAIAEHSANGNSLLLFKKVAQGLRYEGEMVCEGYHHEEAPDRIGELRSAIVFELRALNAVVERVEAVTQPAPNADIESLRTLAFAAATEGIGASLLQSKRNVYQRSNDVRLYVFARSKGICEGCGASAPFARMDGTPYLEAHHIRRVSDGGPDHPAHVIALCPNCHRRVHAGVDGAAFNSELASRMLTIEPLGV